MCRFLKRHFSMCSNWMMTDTDSRELEVYVHIPFCVRKCRYCDFLSAPADAVVREKYVEVLEKQTERWALPGRTVSVFLGGGTPSVLNTEQAGRIMDAVHRCFELTSDCEVTMECNPGTLNREKLEAYRSFGINRLSLGLQSADDTELARLGRIHRFSDFRENYLQAREAGFENISVDLMYGLPGQTVESWTETLKKVLDLRPEHLSVYSLIIEPGTEFYRLYHEDDERRGAGKRPSHLPSEDAVADMEQETRRRMADAGFHRYEISSYARNGFESVHNSGYWTRREYIGLGLGASSLLYRRNAQKLFGSRGTGPVRFHVSRDWNSYLKEDFHAEELQTLSVRNEMEETMFLGLRMTRGVCLDDFYRTFGRSIEEVYPGKMERFCREGLAQLRDGRFSLTDRGMDLSNYVMADFLLT